MGIMACTGHIKYQPGQGGSTAERTHAKGDGGRNDLDLVMRPVVLRLLTLFCRHVGMVRPAQLHIALSVPGNQEA